MVSWGKVLPMPPLPHQEQDPGQGERSAPEMESSSHKQQPNICQALQLQLIILLFSPLFSAFYPLMLSQATQTR